MQLRHALVTLVALVVVAGCGAKPPLAPEPASRPADLASLERTLLDAQAWQADVRVRATGRFTVDLTVTVLATNDNRARIDALGTFDGKPVQVRWVSDGTRTSSGGATEPHTTEAIVVGMTRMGVLHNVAMLIMGGPGPDHAAGGAGDWVVATGEKTSAAGELEFGLSVDGKPSGDVVVGTAPTPQGPVMTKRRITVHFDEGDMFVDEDYTFDLAVELPSDSFVVGGGP
ncbi:MAG TPA: hypothetical protein VM261_01680 [Kofleriaceae bacterium]|nr:hypothetical protein [Kofleriaceae bacterium]